jgi:hypothetical protein
VPSLLLVGKIRDALSDSAEEITPLKQKLDEFGALLAKVSNHSIP